MKSLIKMKNKYTFSGHESFPCKSLWLKKGYDFVANKNDFIFLLVIFLSLDAHYHWTK